MRRGVFLSVSFILSVAPERIRIKQRMVGGLPHPARVRVKNYHSTVPIGRGIAPFWQTNQSEDVAPQVGVVHDSREVVPNEVTIHDDLTKVVLGEPVEHRLEQCREYRVQPASPDIFHLVV